MMGEKGKIKVGEEWEECVFYGIFQKSRVIGPSPMIGGHSGGVANDIVGVFLIKDTLQHLYIDKLQYVPQKDEVELYADDKIIFRQPGYY